MKSDDIVLCELAMELLGYRRIEWAHFLGPSYRQWKPVHVDRLKALIRKRMEVIEAFAKRRQSLFMMVDAWEKVLEGIEATEGYETRVLEKAAKEKKRFRLDDLRRLAASNETTMVALEKAAHKLGWERSKGDRGIVVWIANKKAERPAFKFKEWQDG